MGGGEGRAHQSAAGPGPPALLSWSCIMLGLVRASCQGVPRCIAFELAWTADTVVIRNGLILTLEGRFLNVPKSQRRKCVLSE